ncbi:MAG: papain-like cysteine protease family protein, partial [bacterium]
SYVGHLIAPPLGTSQGLRAKNFAARGNGRGNGYGQSYSAPRSRAFSGQSFDINWNDVELMPQLTTMSCWAAAAAIIIGWRDRISINETEVAKDSGRWQAYQNLIGLAYEDTPAFARDWGLAIEPPQSYSIDGFREMLERNGPLWVGAITPMDHVIVVTGMYSNGNSDGSDTYVRIFDPWGRTPGNPNAPGAYDPTPGQGSRYVLSWPEFIRQYEAGVSTTNGTVNVQILHAGGTGGRMIGAGQGFALSYQNGRRRSTVSQNYTSGYSAKTGTSARAKAFSDEATNLPLFLKEADYSEEIGEAADPEQDVMASGENAALTNEEIYLGRVLQLMQRRDAATFVEIFGPESETLLAVTNAATQQERLQPVGGEPLWSATWVEKFRRAGEVPAFQAAQNEEAIEGLFRPMLKTAGRLGLISDRGLARAYDRVVTRGLGGGLRWLVQAAGALRTAAQRQHALQMLGNAKILGGLTPKALAIGAVAFTGLMCLDIWLWGKMMRESFFNNSQVFTNVGKAILIALSLLLILGWLMAAFGTPQRMS